MITRDENGQVRFGRTLDFFLQALIIANLIAFAFETLPGLTDDQEYWLRMFEIASIGIFTAEYLARCLLSRPVMRYAVSFYGLVDLLSILPFFLTAGVDFRSARALRLMRLFRLFKLTRYSKAARRYRHAFIIAREELVLFGCAALIILYLAAVGIYHFENEAQPDKFSSVPDSMWWAVVTLTTVGYGDVYPITVGGRLFTSCVLIVGLGFVAVPTGLLAGALAKAREHEKQLESEEAAKIAAEKVD
ncbi:MAG: ion transporter [Verrucomicrobiaceae bacterium]|nr:ion transporter [Verrucomicrobiaceae bacterium]